MVGVLNSTKQKMVGIHLSKVFLLGRFISCLYNPDMKKYAEIKKAFHKREGFDYVLVY
jgi:hypothetical protein